MNVHDERLPVLREINGVAEWIRYP